MFLGQASSLGHRIVDSSGAALPFSVATLTALKAIAAADRVHGQEVVVDADNSRWKFRSDGALTGDDIVIATPASGTGTWLRMPGTVDLAFPITFATADAAVLWTVPTGCKLKIHELYWLITTTFAGGSSSAIGVSSAKTGFNTKGDLLGGATGDLTATLVSTTGTVPGTIGVGINSVAKLKTAIWLPTDTIRFDRITSVYTAGVGEVHLMGQLLVNAGS